MSYNYHSADPNEWVLGCIRGYYIRYEQLTGIINTTFNGSTANCVDIFIDMTDIMCRVNQYVANSNGLINNGLVIASGVINMVAHYRNFFTTRYNCNSRFWIIASMSGSVQKLFCNRFVPAIDTLDVNTRKLYMDNLELMDMICKNIPDVQVEVCNCEFVTKVLQIREWEKSLNPAICISKDPFTFQICGSPMISFVLRPRKGSGLDTSYIVSKYNVIESYAFELNKKTKTQIPSTVITADQIAVLMAMSRVPSRHLSTFYNIKSAITKLDNIQIKGYPYDWDFFIDQFNQTPGGLKDPYELGNRFRACDACYLQLEGYKNTGEAKLYNGIVNLYDPAGVKNINNEYFKKYPLDLDSL